MKIADQLANNPAYLRGFGRGAEGSVDSQAEPDPAEFKRLFDAALERIANTYKEGDKDLIDRQAPSLSRRIKDLDREIDRTWFNDMEKFTRAVDEWQRSWLKGCETVHQSKEESSQTNTNFLAPP